LTISHKKRDTFLAASRRQKIMGQTMKVILTKDECEAILLAHVNQRVVTRQGFDRIEIQPGYRLTEFCTVYSSEKVDEATIDSGEQSCQA
jgi:hypothetical protein